MVNRKGLGYIIEAIAAIMTLLVFAVGNTASPPVQDWSVFQEEISANDLGYTLKKTGDLNDFVRDRETGSLQTVVDEMSSSQLDMAGTVSHIPKDSASIGFHVLPGNNNEADLKEPEKCEGDLEDDIDNNPGSEILTLEDSDVRHDTRLYFANTTPEVSQRASYDTMYVDNGSEACQFSSAEGPFYQGDFFKWGNSSSPSEYEHYQFKNLTEDTFIFNLGTQVVNIRNEMRGRLNGIKTRPSFDTFQLSKKDITTYDAVVFRQDDSLDQVQPVYDNSRKLENYVKNGSIFLMMDLEKSDFDTYSFLNATGLEWVDLSYSDPPSGLRLDNNEEGETVQKYVRGMGSRASDSNLMPGGKVSSSNSDTIIGDTSIAYSQAGRYNTQEWNVTNFDMDPVSDPDLRDIAPDSECYGASETGNLTVGEFEFDSKTVQVLNVKLGDTQQYCSKNVRALMFVEDPDYDSIDETEDPYLNGEGVTVGNKSFIARTYTVSGNNPYDNGQAAEFIYSGEDSIEVVNYRRSYESFEGEKLVRTEYKSSYSDPEERRLIGSLIFWLVGDKTDFGSLTQSSSSTYILGGINENIFMPYKLSLRWN